MGRKYGCLRFAIIAILFSASIVIAYVPTDVEAVGNPTVTIELDANKKGVEVSPGSTGIVVFDGVVKAEVPLLPPGQYLIVTLMADAGGWAVSTPPSMTFDNTHTEERFSLSVQVPVETSQKTQGQLSISGKWRYSPGTLGGTVDPVTAIIEIEQYYSYTVSPREVIIKTGTDSVSEVIFDILNKGNSADRISLDITNKEDLEGSGIFPSEKVSDISVPEKQSKPYLIAVVTNTFTPPGKYLIEVQVHSLQAETLGKNYTWEESSCFIEIIEGYVDEIPDPLPNDGDDDIDDNSTILPDDPLEQYSLPDSNPIDRIMIYAGIIIGTLFVLIVALYLFRKVKGS